MKAKVERLRMGLVAGTLLLLAAVAGTYGYSRYKAGKAWLEQAKRRSGINIERETDGFTYSQSLQGKTVFTLHAAKAFQHAGGTYTLHDVVLTLYGLVDKKSQRADRIYGNEFEWDENKGIARAIGEVQMDLQVPSGIAMSERHSAASAGAAAAGDAESIHVRTSGLTFVRQLGVAATAEPIEFHYGGMTCVARGAEFDSSPSALHLLAEVKANGVLRGEPVMLTARRADFDRSTNLLQLVQPIVTESQGKAAAASAVLHLRKDGSVETAAASGGVMLDAGVRHVSAPRLDVVLNEKSQPQTAKLSGGVKLADAGATRPGQGDAGELLVRFDAQGKPADLTATGGAHLAERVARSGGAALERDLRADRITAALVADARGKAQLRQVHATGSAVMRGDSVTTAAGAKAGMKANGLSADDLTADFAMRGTRAQLDKVHGQGHTVLQQTAAGGEQHTSSGDSLDVSFSAGEKGEQEIASAVQQGHVSMMSRGAAKAVSKGKPEAVATGAVVTGTVVTGTAERASYDGESERLTLSGDAHLLDGETSLAAASVTIDQKSGDAEAHGTVVGTLAGKDAAATHVSASRAVVHHATQVAEFFGGAGKPARLWQQASQVEAASITMDRVRKVLTARPGAEGRTVRSIFAGVGVSAAKGNAVAGGAVAGGAVAGGAGKMPSILRVESSLMEYADERREASFSGPVRIDGATGDVRAQRATVFFAPTAKAVDGKRPELGLPAGGLERVVVSGDVQLEQPGRHGTGDQLLYKAYDGSFVLTGTAAAAPRITDSQQGMVTGASLLFRAGDSTIVVAGAAPGMMAAPDGKQPRARIETRVRQKSE